MLLCERGFVCGRGFSPDAVVSDDPHDYNDAKACPESLIGIAKPYRKLYCRG